MDIQVHELAERAQLPVRGVDGGAAHGGARHPLLHGAAPPGLGLRPPAHRQPRRGARLPPAALKARLYCNIKINTFS